MEKLLQWSIAQQTGDKEAQDKIGQPDPKMLSQLFGGPDEPTLMKQAFVVVNHPEATEEDKETALENFEMLIENLDNANNIENMKLWPSVIEQLDSDKHNFQVLAASIIAIATQNNPSSQDAFAKQENGLQKLIALASSPSTPKELQLKATFALASTIRNNESAADKFVAADGLKCLAIDAGTTDTKTLLRKLSLISAVLSTGSGAPRSEQIRSLGLASTLFGVLSPEISPSCIDKALNAVAQLKTLDFAFSDAERAQLKEKVSSIQALADQLSQEDLEAVKKIVA